MWMVRMKVGLWACDGDLRLQLVLGYTLIK